MQFALPSAGAPGDPFGDDKAVLVDTPSDRHSISKTSFKLVEQPFLRDPTPAPSATLGDPFGSDSQPFSPAALLMKVELVSAGKREDFADPLGGMGAPPFFSKIELAPIAKTEFPGFEPAGASAGTPEGFFRKGARKFAVGDRVRHRKHPERPLVVREVLEDGTLRCAEEGHPRGIGVTYRTGPENLIAA